MNKRLSRVLAVFVILVMAVSAVVLVWYTVNSSSMRFRLEEARKDLETAEGRERKQQAEYEKALKDAAAAEEKLASLQAEADAAVAGADAQKAERKELKNRKQELEDRLNTLRTAQEEGSDE